MATKSKPLNISDVSKILLWSIFVAIWLVSLIYVCYVYTLLYLADPQCHFQVKTAENVHSNGLLLLNTNVHCKEGNDISFNSVLRYTTLKYAFLY